MNPNRDFIIDIESILTYQLNQFYQSSYTVKNLEDIKIIKINNLNHSSLYNFSFFKDNEHVFTVYIFGNPCLIYYEFNHNFIFKLKLKRMELNFLNNLMKEKRLIFNKKKQNEISIKIHYLINELSIIHQELISVISFTNHYFALKLKDCIRIENFLFNNYYFLNFLSSSNNTMGDLKSENFLLKDFLIDEFISKNKDKFDNLFSFFNNEDINCSTIFIRGKSVSLKERMDRSNIAFNDFLFNYYNQGIENSISYNNFIPIKNFYNIEHIKNNVQNLLIKENILLSNNEYLKLSKDYFYNNLLDLIYIIENNKNDKIPLYNEIISNDYVFSFIKDKYIRGLSENTSVNMASFRFISNNELEVYLDDCNSVFYKINIKEKTFEKIVDYQILFKNKDIENSSSLYTHLKKELRTIKKYFNSLEFKEIIDEEINSKYKFYLIKNEVIISIKKQ